MELYELKQKVGSDPCVVLDFDATAEIESTNILFQSELKEFDTIEAATKFANDLTALIEELSETRTVVIRFKIHTTDNALQTLNNAVTTNSTLVFGNTEHFGRGFSIICPLPLVNVKMFAVGIDCESTENYSYMVLLKGSVSAI